MVNQTDAVAIITAHGIKRFGKSFTKKVKANLKALQKESAKISSESDRLMRLALKVNRKLKATDFGEAAILKHHDYTFKAKNVLIDTNVKDFAVIYQEHAMPIVVYLPDLIDYEFKVKR